MKYIRRKYGFFFHTKIQTTRCEQYTNANLSSLIKLEYKLESRMVNNMLYIIQGIINK